MWRNSSALVFPVSFSFPLPATAKALPDCIRTRTRSWSAFGCSSPAKTGSWPSVSSKSYPPRFLSSIESLPRRAALDKFRHFVAPREHAFSLGRSRIVRDPSHPLCLHSRIHLDAIRKSVRQEEHSVPCRRQAPKHGLRLFPQLLSRRFARLLRHMGHLSPDRFVMQQ